MIDQELKRCLGQMMKGVQVVGAVHEGTARAYCSHWVCQVSFGAPILMASVSPKHDTHPLIVGSGRFTVSILAADQIGAAQYFSYPGRKFHHIAEELLVVEGTRVGVPDSIAWLDCEVLDRVRELPGAGPLDHDLFFARVTSVESGRLGEPPLLYSSRLGWRATGDKAREPGVSIRDTLLARLEASGATDEVD
jgi:flavin reductase (DIM6/NTAB) family NADH-FMN oxidoreductase RutF